MSNTFLSGQVHEDHAAGLHNPFADTLLHAVPLHLLQNSFFGKANQVYKSNVNYITEHPHILEQLGSMSKSNNGICDSITVQLWIFCWS